mmetsp:Transcript_48382/g.101077  ORF Transcript_48382/g.101077 Transcript_48382/m.101077 type:complete len:90 (+) Transcript_48382:396-665(+)
MQTVPLHEIISAALPRKQGKSPLDVFKDLTQLEIADIAQAVSSSLEIILFDKVTKIKKCCGTAKAKEISGSENNKFSMLQAGNMTTTLD